MNPKIWDIWIRNIFENNEIEKVKEGFRRFNIIQKTEDEFEIKEDDLECWQRFYELEFMKVGHPALYIPKEGMEEIAFEPFKPYMEKT